ncbi:hypothetical protein Daus18300_010753 [Diaporthe australafricana]|uniref:Rhodopsin domain-containing protein n=1 Tax=Diaporthe australafricana TaxID=127596 RepID=A0ABR3W9R7_9PEZI
MSTTDIMDLPAMDPPPGVVPQFDDPPNRNTMALAVLSVCLAATTIVVALRLYSRCAVLRRVQLQDYLLLVSFVEYIAIIGLLYRLANNSGLFVHMWDLRIGDTVEFLRVGVVLAYLVLSAVVPIKTAILMEWISIFLPNTGNRHNLFFWACHFIIWANIILFVVIIILFSVSCVPFEYLWDRTIEGGYCRVNNNNINLLFASFLFATDMIILLIPQRVIWKLNMSRSRKVGVSFVFAFGIAACAASLVRLVYTVQRAKNDDETYNISILMMTAIGEGSCAVLVLCVPAVPKALTGLKLRCLPRRSQEPLNSKDAGVAEAAWPASAEGNEKKHWRTASSSEGHLVPLEQMPSFRQHDPEFGNSIFRIVEFEASASYEPDRKVLLEQHSRQHPWMQS